MSLNNYLKIAFLFITQLVLAQEQTTITGVITDGTAPVPFANIIVEGTTNGVAADENGSFEITLSLEEATLVFKAVGFKTQRKAIQPENFKNKPLAIELQEDLLGLEEVVVSATRNRISKKEAPVIVKVLSPKLFKATQSISLADGLNYQPGVRVETNCQNCGFTQVRLNGLEGQYTQIRPPVAAW